MGWTPKRFATCETDTVELSWLFDIVGVPFICSERSVRRVYHELLKCVKWGGGAVDKSNILSEHVWPVVLGALCALPEVADGKPLWWLVAGAAGGWERWIEAGR